ncbi:hypothetical protein N7539_006114 [Penicillium diatomitis]|uniref:Uncharacterized protein n=1 Tax=Penicillium diatomitis TaxID=2819901 RepID=A0A9W9X2T1_9EURO|nr:uncharacterized protein N7539_006114 [Penicillium diatomitis]KAJ5482668.1 hypothetical protein N7539_006114 [Penicillium diatomitis]
MSAEQFHIIRADFVLKLKQWRRGETDLTPAHMAEILDCMVDDLDHFQTAMTSETAICFPSKCDLIKLEMLRLIEQLKLITTINLEIGETMSYIGAAIGRITLEGKSCVDDIEDLEAARATVEFHHIHKLHVWDMPELGFTDEAEQLRVRLWTVYTNVNFSRGGCGCFQCRTAWIGGR